MRDKLAIADIGTNSIKILIAQRQNNCWKIINDVIFPYRFTQEDIRNGLISLQAIIKLLTKLEMIFTSYPIIRQCDIHLIGTHVFRTIKNLKELINQIENELSCSFRIVSPEEEAGLVRLAVLSDFDDIMDKVWAVLDLGGGSTELVISKGTKSLESISFPYGAVNLTRQFITHDPISDKEYTEMTSFLNSKLVCNPHDFQIRDLYSTGGTITTLALIHILKPPDQMDSVHQMKLNISDIGLLIDKFIKMDINQKARLTGMTEGRADIILAGARIILTVMQKLHQKEVIVSAKGLRYGYLYSLTH